MDGEMVNKEMKDCRRLRESSLGQEMEKSEESDWIRLNSYGGQQKHPSTSEVPWRNLFKSSISLSLSRALRRSICQSLTHTLCLSPCLSACESVCLFMSVTSLHANCTPLFLQISPHLALLLPEWR